VELKAGLEAVEKRKFFPLLGFEFTASRIMK
jgi:hypothetical protein